MLGIVIFLSVVSWLGLSVAKPLARAVFPVPYREVIGRFADAEDLDPFLVVAIIRVESRFDPRAVSAKEARGLMQLMPTTGAWVGAQLGLPPGTTGPEALFDPELNIRLGTWYLSYLREQFNGRLTPTLAAYNGGHANVKRWLQTEQWSGERRATSNIPFPETRNYVERVSSTHDWYRHVYDGRWEEVGRPGYGVPSPRWFLGLLRLAIAQFRVQQGSAWAPDRPGLKAPAGGEGRR